MTNVNYSKDTLLIAEEILDYDIFNKNETGINDGRMRLPNRYDISKYYQRNKRNRGKHRKGEYGQWKKKAKEDLLDFSDDFDWQITYNFPAMLRDPYVNNVQYGGKAVTFRRLYLILCEHFNGGEYFIDTYFESVYPYTIKSMIDEYLADVKEELMGVAEIMFQEANELNRAEGIGELQVNKDGTLSRRAFVRNKRAYEALDEYEQFAEEWEENEGVEVAKLIKEDIISCVTSGQLPCQIISTPKESTIKKRLRAGLGATPLFSATEQLIKSLQLFVNIGGNNKWQIQSGLLV